MDMGFHLVYDKERNGSLNTIIMYVTFIGFYK